MTDKEIIERGMIFKELIQCPGWKLLNREIEEFIGRTTESLYDSPEKPMTVERAEVNGINSVLQRPIDAIIEADELLKKGTADQV